MIPKGKIRVLECIRQGKIGGGESHLLSLVENLDKSVFEPVVLSFTDGPMIERLSGMDIPTHIIHTEKPFDFRIWNKVKQFIRSQQVSLIHAHGTRANSNILWAANQLKIPVIYTIHGWSFHDDQSWPVKKIRILGEKYLTKKSARNISVSQSNKETGLKHFNRFTSLVINNGIDQNKFNPDKAFRNIRAEMNLSPDVILYCFIGRFTHQKQPLVLIDAFLQAAQKNNSIHLLIVGDGEDKARMENRIQDSGMNNRVTMMEPSKDIPALLAAADVFVLPSLWEGLPIALLEAMAMGKAIIASEVDGTKEIITHRENGYLIQTDQLLENLVKAMIQVSADSGLRETLSRNARKTIAERFDAGFMTRKIEKVYLEILEKQKQPA